MAGDLRSPIRLLPDSNVITGGIVSFWGLDKAVLSLCSARICKLVLADAVKEEVERNIRLFVERLGKNESTRFLEDYDRMLALANPERVPRHSQERIVASRHFIRHESDVPVLLSAIDSQPDWLLTNNTKHFTSEVALRTGLRISTPIDFFRTLTSKASGLLIH
jgi:hypothetical protein